MSILGMKVYLEIVLGNHCSIELTIQLVSCAHWKTTALSNDSAWNCKDFFLQRVHRYAFFMGGFRLGSAMSVHVFRQNLWNDFDCSGSTGRDFLCPGSGLLFKVAPGHRGTTPDSQTCLWSFVVFKYLQTYLNLTKPILASASFPVSKWLAKDMERAQRREWGTGAQREQRLGTMLWQREKKVSSSGQGLPGFHRNPPQCKDADVVGCCHGSRPFLCWNARRWYVCCICLHVFLMFPWCKIRKYLFPPFLVVNPATLLWLEVWTEGVGSAWTLWWLGVHLPHVYTMLLTCWEFMPHLIIGIRHSTTGCIHTDIHTYSTYIQYIHTSLHTYLHTYLHAYLHTYIDRLIDWLIDS